HFSKVSLDQSKSTFAFDLDVSYSDFSSSADLIVVMGGDGTLLGAARRYHKYDLPILGINMGTVGFLTEVTVTNFEEAIVSILKGDYKIEERSLIKATFDNKEIQAVNEIVIHSGSYTQLMRYKLNINNKIVYEKRSDGLIISTTTGSTAYALSAGGPIIHPNLDVWTVLPMLSQSLSSRPFVISSDELLSVNILEGSSKQGKICADGQEDIDVSYMSDIKISKIHKPLKLIHLQNNDFFEACREKLGWSLDISNPR
ncbi:NAD(+)/NADH kinase, partial [Gammaproteobacteria bacterium]|nr:NAD(+)/NADH kinase [Gammaproteobacteria bacterium]